MEKYNIQTEENIPLRNPSVWDNYPYKVGHQRKVNLYEDVFEYMNGRFTLRDVYIQILNKECPLSKSRRDYVEAHFINLENHVEKRIKGEHQKEKG